MGGQPDAEPGSNRTRVNDRFGTRTVVEKEWKNTQEKTAQPINLDANAHVHKAESNTYVPEPMIDNVLPADPARTVDGEKDVAEATTVDRVTIQNA